MRCLMWGLRRAARAAGPPIRMRGGAAGVCAAVGAGKAGFVGVPQLTSLEAARRTRAGGVGGLGTGRRPLFRNDCVFDRHMGCCEHRCLAGARVCVRGCGGSVGGGCMVDWRRPAEPHVLSGECRCRDAALRRAHDFDPQRASVQAGGHAASMSTGGRHFPRRHEKKCVKNRGSVRPACAACQTTPHGPVHRRSGGLDFLDALTGGEGYVPRRCEQTRGARRHVSAGAGSRPMGGPLLLARAKRGGPWGAACPRPVQHAFPRARCSALRGGPPREPCPGQGEILFLRYTMEGAVSCLRLSGDKGNERGWGKGCHEAPLAKGERGRRPLPCFLSATLTASTQPTTHTLPRDEGTKFTNT